ncbi:MAG: hypothetical protein K6F79_00210 [Saccharofermentans sp.]|nr:hypothetical protein [Saccharofermentans sp.]
MLRGIGAIALIGMYAFRMCILPVLCAHGNFYLEPPDSIYLPYFRDAIVLMCIECTIVVFSLSLYSTRFANRVIKYERFNYVGTNDASLHIYVVFTICLYLFIFLSNKSLLTNHYHFLLSSSDEASAFEQGHVTLQGYGSIYYLLVLLDLVAKPLISFALINWSYSRSRRLGIFISVIVGSINILFVSDRRVLSLLIGVCCLFQALLHIKKKIIKRSLYYIIAIMAILTLVYCFWGEDTPIRIARKFQRYFSGPSLTAIGIVVYKNYVQTPVDFLKLLFNDSVLLTGLFGSFESNNYVLTLCGPSGKSIWTPMFIGSIQYFHILGFIMPVFAVKFITYTDYRSMASNSNLRIMMMNYLAVSTSVYMVMYSIELVYYNIIFIGGFYYLLMNINNHMKYNIQFKRGVYAK